jgi:hypothetical protein
MQGDLERVLFDEPAILRRLDEIAAQISKDCRDRELTVAAGRFMPIMLALKSRMNLWSVTGSISGSATAISLAPKYCERN